jgi:predicted ArsR family transcriptional regulator
MTEFEHFQITDRDGNRVAQIETDARWIDVRQAADTLQGDRRATVGNLIELLTERNFYAEKRRLDEVEL